MLKSALNHLLTNVIPAAQDYDRAENELLAAFAHALIPPTGRWPDSAPSGVPLRLRLPLMALDLGITPDNVCNAVAPYCTIDSVDRPGSIERVCAVANAYKHAGSLRGKHPVASESDILATGAGYGIDGNGIGKFGGVEVLVTERDGTVRKFLGDLPWAIAGWFQFLAAQGVALPPNEYRVCGLCVKAADPAARATGSQP